MPSSADPGKTIIVPPLKYICLSSYLAFLESACAGNFYNCADTTFQRCFLAFIQLRMNPNPLFKRLTSSMLPALKNHLETTLSGACFSALRSLGPLMTRPSKHIVSSQNVCFYREQMLEMLFSGKFPSSSHKNTYAGLSRN